MQSLTDMFMNSSKHNEHSEGMDGFGGGGGKDGAGGSGTSSLIHSNLSDVNHVKQLSLDIGNLFNNTDYCDVVLVVDGVEFKAHKIILAARSEYFRALLFSGMRETNSDRIEITAAARPAAFKLLLQYIYTGKISLRNEKEESLIDLLGLVHQYGFVELQKSISNYLESILDLRNVCQIYNISSMYQLKSLEETCARFIDRNCQLLIKQNTLLQLSCESLASIISRDSFSASEIDIFNLVREWHEANGVKEPRQDLIDKIRLPLMKMEELLNEVRQSTLIDPNTILDAIKVQRESNSMSLRYRGLLYPNENVATARYQAQVVKGDFKPALLDGDVKNYDLDRGFTYHPIDETNQHSIVVRLGAPTIFNQIKLLLWDRDLRSYSYFVEVSMDEKDWIKIVDYSDYMCRSWQNLVFTPVVARYIQITGVRNTANRIFHLVSMEVRYIMERYELSNQLIVPHFNVATVGKGAIVLEGVSRTKNALINGDFKNYDWDSGYTCHQLGNGSISVQLAQPYVLSSLRLLLWDCDNRSYGYFIETSLDQSNWFMVADKRNDECRSWQVVVFKPRPVSFIRITGTHNTANEVFHCVHFEAPCDPFVLSRFMESNTQPNLHNTNSSTVCRSSNPINISPLSQMNAGLHNLNTANSSNFQSNSVANSAFSVASSHSMSSSLNATTCSIVNVNTDSNINSNNAVNVANSGNNSTSNNNNNNNVVMTTMSVQQQQSSETSGLNTAATESSFQFDSLIDDLIVASNREREDNDTASTYSEMNEN